MSALLPSASAAMQIFRTTRAGSICAAHRQRRAQHHHERGERCIRFVDGCAVVEYFLQLPFDRDALDFSCFTVHLRFCATRISRKTGTGKTIHDENVLRPDRRRNFAANTTNAPAALRSMSATPGTELSDEELVFPYDPSETDPDGKIAFLLHLDPPRSFLCGYICWIRT